MRVQTIAKNIVLQAICIAMVVIVILPILLTLFAAFKTGADMVNTSPLALPPLERITFANFEKVFGDKNLYTGFRNTLTILAVSLVFNVMFGTITAYIIERFDFRLKKFVVSLFFLGMLIPTFVTEISRFKIISGLGLYNTLGAPIVIYVASDLMQLYIYRQFISKISVSLDESAILDGCSYWGLFSRIIFPLLTIPLLMLFHLPSEVSMTVLIAAACPSATTGTMMAIRYKQNYTYSSEMFALSTILAVATIPLIVLLAETVL